MPTMTKLRTYVRNTGTSGRNASQSVPCGTFSSRTMIVIRIAITPSLNASRRPLLILSSFQLPASGFPMTRVIISCRLGARPDNAQDGLLVGRLAARQPEGLMSEHYHDAADL